MVLDTVHKVTGGFEKGFSSYTLMGWKKIYDKEGREVSVDPNFREGFINIEGKDYWFIRKGWEVRLYDTPTDYCDWMKGSDNPIEVKNLKPDYVDLYFLNAS
ncbi:MAG: hypothetical protein ACPGVB_15370 [Chitinophagales bacterium]